jgi:hypothetical protein
MIDLNEAMQKFRDNKTIYNAFNVRSHIHPDIPGQENADTYLIEINAFIGKELDKIKPQ